ncbi:IclR family transcriptional regulator domain-containing protein [Burkholderia sp. WSM2232]|uniref:IclR family transcriptional regulator domain-containing protein n=1 Tax=Burkholderia sp. WSM2232 TaxID=944436 RepID=UPI0018DDDA16
MYAPSTITNVDAILRLLDQVRERGFASAYDEFFRTDMTIAVPLHNAHGRAIGAINISASSMRWSPEQLEEQIVPLLIENCTDDLEASC